VKAAVYPLKRDLDFLLEHSGDIWKSLRNQQISSLAVPVSSAGG